MAKVSAASHPEGPIGLHNHSQQQVLGGATHRVPLDHVWISRFVASVCRFEWPVLASCSRYWRGSTKDAIAGVPDARLCSSCIRAAHIWSRLFPIACWVYLLLDNLLL